MTLDDNHILGRIGSLEVRLVADAEELDASQALRYRIFSSEFGTVFEGDNAKLKRDRDAFDAVCDHLIVVDTSVDGAIHEQLVGTYRMSTHAWQDGMDTQLYSQGEYDVASLMQRHPGKVFLELGRSCVLPAYRGRRTIELLWQGIWAYCRRNNVDAMIGCASFSGIDPSRHALPLSFLYHHAHATGDWAVEAHPHLKVDMNLMAADSIGIKEALDAMPALIKGYLRLGAKFGTGAVIDPVFKTIDVMVVLPVAQISERYVKHYGENADRFVG